MSRSRKKNPICGNACAESDKRDKQIANRAFRRKSREALRNDTEPVVDIRQVSNICDFAKDGRHYISPENQERYMRK
jgi:hypothetical protein